MSAQARTRGQSEVDPVKDGGGALRRVRRDLMERLEDVPVIVTELALNVLKRCVFCCRPTVLTFFLPPPPSSSLAPAGCAVGGSGTMPVAREVNAAATTASCAAMAVVARRR